MAVTLEELAKHNTAESAWIAVEGSVYDVTDFANRHPGGKAIILKVAGTDATKQFLKFHPTDVITKMIRDTERLGALEIEPSAGGNEDAEDEDETPEERALAHNRKHMPNLGEVFNLLDFELIARNTLNRVGWYYYSSGSDDEITMRENHRAFQRIWFRPKVMVDVRKVDFSTTMLGHKTACPFYISATALARLGHEDGEVVMTRAAAKEGVIQMLSNLASCSIEEVAEAANSEQAIWQQVYVNADREATETFIKLGEQLGVKGFFVTVDAPQLGRREKDMRTKYDEELAEVNDEDSADRSQGAARAISGFIDAGLSWKDMPWLRSITKKPLALKGIQRWEDAVRAAEAGCDAIVISNHGGRQLEFSRSSIEVLAEVMVALRKRNLHKSIEVYIDGGIRRGTDIIKALCLGARGVGIGRPFLYAMATYGDRGVVHAIQLLKDELEMNMRLLGAPRLRDLNPKMLDIRSLSAHDAVPSDHSTDGVYEKLTLPEFKTKL